MSPFSEYASWAALAIAIVAALPRIASIWTRKRHLDTKGEIDRFEVTLAAQDKLLTRAQDRCTALEAELKNERTERVAARDYFFEQLAASNKRLHECEGILARRGWTEPRKTRRDNPGRAG